MDSPDACPRLIIYKLEHHSCTLRNNTVLAKQTLKNDHPFLTLPRPLPVNLSFLNLSP